VRLQLVATAVVRCVVRAIAAMQRRPFASKRTTIHGIPQKFRTLRRFAPKNWRNMAQIHELSQHGTLPPAEASVFSFPN
jgi:hypothetical protein